jgi:chromosome segregation ATPase
MKKNYLMEIIREEISSYLGENEPMYDSPQTQQREVNSMLDQVENLKKLRDELDAQIAQLETIANTFNVNEDAAANKAAVDAQRMAIDKRIAALNKTKQELSKPGTTLEEEQNNILISSNLIRSYITELIYYSEDMEYTPEMIKKLKDLKGGLSGGKISIEDALDVVQQTIDITGDEIDAIEALGQAVDYDDHIICAL